MMDTSQTMTLDEAVHAFDRIAAQWIGIEESFDVNQDEVAQMEKDIELVEKTIIGENLFSENEDYEEIDEEHAK
jgi:hypothetical protein